MADDEVKTPKTKPGRRSVTSHDVALLAGVSQATVSRALRGDERITNATSERVHRAAREIGYIPDAIGRSFARRETHQIGVVVSDLTNPFYPNLISAISRELELHGYRAVLLLDNNDDAVMLRSLADGSVDGAILTSSLLDSTLPQSLLDHRLPVVLVNRYIDGLPVDACVVDNTEGARQIAHHVLNLGHRDIAVISGPQIASTGRDRMRGFRSAFADHGLEIPERLIRDSAFTFEGGRAEMLSLLDSGEHFTAVLCGNDILALGALDAAVERGVRVPEDLTITGYDDMPMAAWGRVDLTTVRQDTDGIGREGVRLLVARLRSDPSTTRRISLAPVLVRRGTDAAPSDEVSPA